MESPTRNWIIMRAIALCLVNLSLTGCLFLPGHFQSELRIDRDGQFLYRYTGELVFLLPEERLASWDDTMALCHDETAEGFEPRACRTEEIVRQREDFHNRRMEDIEAGQSLAALVGYNPVDPAANQAFAKELEQSPGWKKVEYRGFGRFYTEYELRGRLDRDFLFPVMPAVQLAMPFVVVSPNRGGKISISAAGLASPQLKNALSGRGLHRNGGGERQSIPAELRGFSQGRFVVTTAGRIAATNGITSREGDRHRVEWLLKGIDSPTPNLEIDLEP